MSFAEMERGLDDVLGRNIGSKLGGQSAVHKVSALAEADDTLTQANAIAMRIMGLADRLCGPVPASGEKSGAGEGPGALNTFRAHMRDTRQALVYADEALSRIERELIG